MGQNGTFNILMYSHDTYGLGHIRRTMAIASQLCSDGINILILTGSPIAGRFTFPEQIDFVRIPGMIKRTNEEYRPLSIKINPRHALDIRKNIITATAKTFQPHLFIVDKEPLGLKKEVLPTLRWIRRCLPHARTILGLRDIMDDAETVRRDWWKKNVFESLDKLYSEIWIYGNQDFYDPIIEYGIPEPVKRKMLFTGYIPRPTPSRREAQRIRREVGVAPEGKLIVVTTGGGGDGFALMDTYLSMLGERPLADGFKSVLVTGPFMPKEERKGIFKRARKTGVQTFMFYRRMEKTHGRRRSSDQHGRLQHPVRSHQPGHALPCHSPGNAAHRATDPGPGLQEARPGGLYPLERSFGQRPARQNQSSSIPSPVLL